MSEMFSSGWSWLAIPIGIAVFVYGGLPLLIYVTFKNEAHATLKPFVPSDPTLPLPVREHFKNACDELMPLGFEYVAGLSLPQMTENAMAILIVLVNRQTVDAAAAISIYGKSNDTWVLQTSYIEYSSRFRSGLTINTQNSPALSAFPPLEDSENHRFPTVRDARQLYQVHERLLSQQNLPAKVLRLDEEFDGDILAFIRTALNQEMVGAAKAGYLYLTPDSKYFRATIKGALLMTWQELFPFKQIRRAYRDRQAKQQLAALSFPSK